MAFRHCQVTYQTFFKSRFYNICPVHNTLFMCASVPCLQHQQAVSEAIVMCACCALVSFIVNNAAISIHRALQGCTYMTLRGKQLLEECVQPALSYTTHTICRSQKWCWKPLVLSKMQQTKLCHCCITSHCICRQAALERQDLSCTYLAYHELENT